VTDNLLVAFYFQEKYLETFVHSGDKNASFFKVLLGQRQ